MSHKKIKHEIREKIAEAVQQVLTNFNSEAGERLKKSSRNCAKEISNKFVKTLKKVEKAERKASKKIAKKEQRATKLWLKGHDSEERKVSKEHILSTYPIDQGINTNDTSLVTNNVKLQKEKFHIET